ncbi:MAG TPA: preprotein translocase subunit SecE [Thermoleophilia bacterium]|nr:preprotein translocase subunit SecE [Thermoleophilia bacterium]
MAKAVKSTKQKSPARQAKQDARKAARAAKPPERARRQSKAPAKAERRGLSKFFHDVRIELSKVTWPTRKDLTQSTIVVIVAVVIASVYIAALDGAFSNLMKLITP